MTPEALQRLMQASTKVINWDIQPAGSAGFVLLRSEPGQILPQVMGKYPSVAQARSAAEAMMKKATAKQMARYR